MSELVLIPLVFAGLLFSWAIFRMSRGHEIEEAPPAPPVRFTLPSFSRPRVETPSLAVSHLPTREWLSLLNERPDTYPHLLVVGPTGSGKTTFCKAVLSGRDGSVCILSPKIDPWELSYHTIDDDGSFAGIAQVVASVHTEVKTRLVHQKRGGTPGHTLTIILDDYPVLISEVPEVKPMLKLVARLGRSLRVRLICLSQSDRVKSMGLEGEGDARDNFALVRLTRQHTATVETEGQSLTLDIRKVARLANSRLSVREWIPNISTIGGANQPDIEPDIQNIGRDIYQQEGKYRDITPERVNIILKAIDMGMTRTEVSRLMGGNHNRNMEAIRDVLNERQCIPRPNHE